VILELPCAGIVSGFGVSVKDFDELRLNRYKRLKLVQRYPEQVVGAK
jgi:hypothetical protein